MGTSPRILEKHRHTHTNTHTNTHTHTHIYIYIYTYMCVYTRVFITSTLQLVVKFYQ